MPEVKMPEIGARVGAILSVHKNDVRFLGWGVYLGAERREGVEIPTFEAMVNDYPALMEGQTIAEARVNYEATIAPNGPLGNHYYHPAMIRLDSGKTVLCHECHWAGEAEMQDYLKGKGVMQVDVDDARKSATEFIGMLAESKLKKKA